LNWSVTIRDCDAPVGPGTASFLTAPACDPVTVDYRPNSGVLSTATQIFAHVGFNDYTIVFPSQPMTKISNNVWRITIQPETNATQLDLVFNNGAGTWDNNSGADWTFVLNVCEGEPLPTGFAITNPPAPVVVGNATLTYNLQGIGESIAGDLRWTNSFTGGSGGALAGIYWTIAGVPLGVGTNVITVTGTNSAMAIVTNASDRGANAVYGDGWDASDNGGFGFGAWQFFTSSGDPNQNGRFMATADAVTIGKPAWGLYANSGQLSEAKRALLAPLTTAQTFSVSFENGFIDTGAGAGVALQNAGGETLWEFFFNGGDTYYSISGGTTDVGFTDGAIDITFRLTGPTNYLAEITPPLGGTRVLTGNLESNTNSSEIALFRAWNNFAGGGSERDVFFNNLALVSMGSGDAFVTNDTAVIVREPGAGGDSNGDGVPDWWYEQYGLNPATPGLGGQNADGDTLTNWEEYLFDTNPTNAASYNLNAITAIGDEGGALIIDAPTSTGRLYDVYWSTSLLHGSGWTPYGLDVPGNPTNGALSLPVPNTPAVLYYRTGVKLPTP
jgi:hypothetical protein